MWRRCRPSWKPTRAAPPSGQCTPSLTSTGERAFALIAETLRRRPLSPSGRRRGLVGSASWLPESAGRPAPAAPTLPVLPAVSRTPAPRLLAREHRGGRSALWAEGVSHWQETASGSQRGGHRAVQVFCSFLVDQSLGFRTATPSATRTPPRPTSGAVASLEHGGDAGRPRWLDALSLWLSGLTGVFSGEHSNSGPEKRVTVEDAVKRHQFSITSPSVACKQASANKHFC